MMSAKNVSYGIGKGLKKARADHNESKQQRSAETSDWKKMTALDQLSDRLEALRYKSSISIPVYRLDRIMCLNGGSYVKMVRNGFNIFKLMENHLTIKTFRHVEPWMDRKIANQDGVERMLHSRFQWIAGRDRKILNQPSTMSLSIASTYITIRETWDNCYIPQLSSTH